MKNLLPKSMADENATMLLTIILRIKLGSSVPTDPDLFNIALFNTFCTCKRVQIGLQGAITTGSQLTRFLTLIIHYIQQLLILSSVQ